jgi:cytokinesis protein
MSRSHRANSSLARRHDNSLDYNDYDPCSHEEHDAESEFGQSTGSGFTILTDDTQPTSVSSNASSEASRGAPSGSFTDQLMKKLKSRGRVPSVSDGSPMRQLPSLPGESDAPSATAAATA